MTLSQIPKTAPASSSSYLGITPFSGAWTPGGFDMEGLQLLTVPGSELSVQRLWTAWVCHLALFIPQMESLLALVPSMVKRKKLISK
jgi:hypothetical protein